MEEGGVVAGWQIRPRNARHAPPDLMLHILSPMNSTHHGELPSSGMVRHSRAQAP
jgi:hypothetical protein